MKKEIKLYSTLFILALSALMLSGCGAEKNMKKGDQYVAAYHPMFAVYTTNCDPSNSNVELKQPYDYTKPNYTNMTNGRRHRLIRWSEVLLWYAESAARSGAADLTAAKEYLREVRKRAVTDYENVTLSDGTKVAIANMTADQLAAVSYTHLTLPTTERV